MPKLKQGDLPSEGQFMSLVGRFKDKPLDDGRRITNRKINGYPYWRVEKRPTVTGRLKLREFGRAAIKGSEDNRPRG